MYTADTKFHFDLVCAAEFITRTTGAKLRTLRGTGQLQVGEAGGCSRKGLYLRRADFRNFTPDEIDSIQAGCTGGVFGSVDVWPVESDLDGDRDWPASVVLWLRPGVD